MGWCYTHVSVQKKAERAETDVREKRSRHVEVCVWGGGEIRREKMPRIKVVGRGLALLTVLVFLGYPSPPPPSPQPFSSNRRSTIPVWSKTCKNVTWCESDAPSRAAEVAAMPRWRPKLRLGRAGKMATDGSRDEEARPPPAEMLRQQGIHPHHVPAGRVLDSILDDEYWDQCDWTTVEPGVPAGVFLWAVAVGLYTGVGGST